MRARLDAVESRDTPITLREIARTLEAHICLQVAGSKTKAKNLYNFSRIDASNDQRAITHLNTLAGVGLRNLIGRLKDDGDTSAHDGRPQLNEDELKKLLFQPDDEDDDKKEKNDFIMALHAYNIFNNGAVVLAKPF
jgi:hypothetical protein